MPPLSQGLSVISDQQAKAERETSDKPWLFTKEQAAEFGRKGYEARMRNEAARKQALIEAEQFKASCLALAQPGSDDSYRLGRLKATRDALDGLYSDLNDADDPKDQKAICDSIARLSEVERLLAGRPSPGSCRPSSKPTKPRTPENYGPVE